MKLFEFGQYIKSVKIQDKYHADWEDDDTILLYNPLSDYALIRISAITVDPVDPENNTHIFNETIEQANTRNLPLKIVGDKAYFTYQEKSSSEDEELLINYYHVGYKNHLIVISASTYIKDFQKKKTMEICSDIEEFIPTFSDIYPSGQTIFEPTYTEFAEIQSRIAAILKIEINELETSHSTHKTIDRIQTFLDQKIYDADDTVELQSLGLAFGDYIASINNNFHWTIVRDEYGRDPALQFQNYSITIFPLTMLSKRIEDGIDINVNELLSSLLTQIESLVKSGKYRIL